MANSNQANNGGVGFLGLLLLLFIGLKLTGFILWSWFWVLSPLWIILLFCIVVGLIVAANDKPNKKS